MRIPCVILVLGLAGSAAVLAAAETDSAHLVNIAARASVGGVAGTPITGFVLRGTGTKPMVVRAVGPTLGSYGVTNALADPRLTLVGDAGIVGSNDNWLAGDAAGMSAAGGFALPVGSKDAALVVNLGRALTRFLSPRRTAQRASPWRKSTTAPRPRVSPS
jgi:hypothetical protein